MKELVAYCPSCNKPTWRDYVEGEGKVEGYSDVCEACKKAHEKKGPKNNCVKPIRKEQNNTRTRQDIVNELNRGGGKKKR